MCGLTGFIERAGGDRTDAIEIVNKMTDSLIHRGPDDRGVWLDENAGLALGFRRLAILDLSREGHQPMMSPCDRYVIVFNGEIYNHRELKQQVLGTGRFNFPFRGHSDTEVLLAAFSVWKPIEVAKRLNGMFAIALWDKIDRTLYLIRDRFGEKPLYYGLNGQTFIFGSELKALCQHPSFDGTLDLNALALFFRHNYIPNPKTIYKTASKLPPAHLLTLNCNSTVLHPVVTCFWSPREEVEHGLERPYRGTFQDAVSDLDALLRDSVALRMEADVPLGAFLSGGIDSSTIAALMQSQSSRSIQTFTIGFWEKGFDEAPFAKAVANHLGTDHTETYVSADEALAMIPKIPHFYDEPFSDSSQIPTLLVSQSAKRHVTVCLSGDGGDEIFGGYNRYFWGQRIWDRVNRIPSPVRAVASSTISMLSPGAWEAIYKFAKPFLPARLRVSNPADKIVKLKTLLDVDGDADSISSLYLPLVSHWRNPTSLVKNSVEPRTPLTDPSLWPTGAGFIDRMMFLDTVTYLPDDILAKVDRASMAVSLESRVPFLDHRIFEFAWTLPLNFKIHDGQGKYILRQVLDKYVPKSKIDRPKMGFGIPIGGWLRTSLRDWAENLLDKKKLECDGILNAGLVQEMWRDHISGRTDWQYHLWDVLMFQAWKELHSPK